MATHRADVVVIGSGFGAMAPALRLAEAGLQVVVLEKGPHVDVADFRQTQDPAYLTRYLKGLSGPHLNFTYAEALGGGSGFYEMVSLRAPSSAFRQLEGSGRPLWPEGLDRAALDPWYALAEGMLEVEQIGAEQIPRSGLVFALMMKNLGYTCDRAPYAVRNCVGSGFCVTGCIYGAKRSLHKNYIPRALEAGVRFECEVDAESIRLLRTPRSRAGSTTVAEIPHRYEVRSLGRNGRKDSWHARLVILAGGTVGTGLLLLRSRPWLRRLSPALGRHIATNGGVKVCGLLGDDLPDGDMFTGRTHPGMISYQFLESHGFTVAAVKAMPIQVVASARLHLDGDPREPWWWGEANVEMMRQFRRRAMVLLALGLTPPCGSLALDPAGRPLVEFHPDPEIDQYEGTARQILESILTGNGCRLIRTEWVDSGGNPRSGSWHSTAHHTGSARMADRWEHGVVDPLGEVFGYPGLYVTDGAAIPSSLAVNTSLTILANAERIGSGILTRYGLPREGLTADLSSCFDLGLETAGALDGAG